MSGVELSSALLAEMAGWEAMKQARGIVAAGRVLSSEYQPPVLRGSVQAGESTFRSGLVIKSKLDVENLCPCRESRQRGIICAHSVAVGLHYLQQQVAPEGVASAPKPQTAPAAPPARPARPAKALRRANNAEGEPLEVFCILPPNFADAVARGKIMVCLEGKWRRGRTPLNSLPLDVPFALEPADAALLTALEQLSDGDTPALVMVDPNQLAGLLPQLIGHPRLSFGKGAVVEVAAIPLLPPLRASLEPNGAIVARLVGAAPKTVFGPVGRQWCLTDRTLHPFGLPAGTEELLKGPMRIGRERVPLFLNHLWPALSAGGNAQADFALEDFTLETAEPRFKLHLAGGLAMLEARLDCYYGNQSVASMASDAFWLPDPADPRRYRTRDFDAEREAMARLVRSGFTGPDAKGVYHLKGQNLVLNFFAREYPRIEREWEATLEERLDRSARNNIERIEPRFQVTPSGESWFDFNIQYRGSTGQQFSPAEIQRLLLSGQSHTRLPSGKFAVLDTGAVEELQEVLVDCAPEQQAGSYRMSNVQAGFLQATIAQNRQWQVQAPSAWRDHSVALDGSVKLETPPLGELENVLRPYQKQGVAWLGFLRRNGFGGILADEMGLGKTVQVLAHLRAKAPADPVRPSLVVCPSSLVFNWAAEAAKFTPGLRALALSGPERAARFSQIADHDLVITSYSLLRRDADQYRGLEFDTVVLDEAQHIKNRQTQNAQTVKSVRCRHRLVLTGTPLENSVLDLWSIFDFLMPGYLGSAPDFRERYEVPIVREKHAAVRDRLARRIRPFMLRRLKQEVAADLPRKIEQVSYCDLTDSQRELYQQVLEASRVEIVNAVDKNGVSRSRIVVLTALLRLRQICCDPRLLKLENPGNVEASGPRAGAAGGEETLSGKVELFAELLEEILDGSHRVLVFSQFTSMLALLREHLAALDIAFCYLDGSTMDRAGVVSRFQTDARIPVFLISLKAGGLGLNLTAADTVIHFDPWWNPAVEAQATDRAHRIGQQRVVTSYKLITRGTVEEKILNLQARKRALFEGMLGTDDQFAEAVSWDEIQELLA